MQVKQGLLHATQLGGSIELSGYMLETQEETQTREAPDIFKYGNVEFGLHLVQNIGISKQFKQLLSQGAQSKVTLLLYVVSGQFT
jgi:hypothetical protein